MMLLLKKNNIFKLLLKLGALLFVVIVLYLYIYNPPFLFLPISASKLLYCIFLPYFILNKQIRRGYFSFFSVETFLLIVIIGYSFCVEFLNSASNRIYSSANLFMLFENFFFAFSIAYFLLKHYKNSVEVILLFVTAIAAFITIYLIINPDINLLVRQFILHTDDVAQQMLFRSFGIAESLTFAYAIVQGIAVALCLEYSKNGFLSCFLFILYLISAAFNARIGLIPILGILFYMLAVERKIAKVVSPLVLLAVLLFFVFGMGFAEDYERTIEWVFDFFEEIFMSITGTKATSNTNMDILLNDMVVVPQTLGEWIFGTGKDLYRSSVRNSDIGYFIQLNYGGLLYVFFFILLILSLSNKLLKYKTEKWFAFLFVMTILTCSFKGLFLVTNPGFRMLMLLYFVYFMRVTLFRTRETLILFK